MSPPLPIPSKAAIRTLRGIALGTSCAIGVIVEDRRRRISTLKTAAANKEKIRSSRRYNHSASAQALSQLEDVVVVRQSIQWHEVDGADRGKHGDAGTIEDAVAKSLVLEKSEAQDPHGSEITPKSTPIPQLPPSPSSSSPFTVIPHISPSMTRQIKLRAPMIPAEGTTESSPTPTSKPDPPSTLEDEQTVLRSIGNGIASKDKKRLRRTVSVFISNMPRIPSSSLRATWHKLAARLSTECAANERWDLASQILTGIIDLGSLEEAQYLAHNPASIIRFHLKRPDSDTPLSMESLVAAAHLFLAKFKKNGITANKEMECVGKELMLAGLSLLRFNLVHRIHWRLLSWAVDAEAFVRWTIHTYFACQDYKSVMKCFLLHYSRMTPSAEHFYETIECVVSSIEALKGSWATRTFEAFVQMECPEGTKFHETWIAKILRVNWERYEDVSKSANLFEQAESLMLADKISCPEVIYSTVVEIAVKSGNEELSNLHAQRAIRAFPMLEDEISLKLVVFKAKAGDWHGVVEAFRQVRPGELAARAFYDGAFVPVLKVWAETHSAIETKDFALLFTRDLGVKFHRYMVTLVANKFGETRDLDGFLGWLQTCSDEGFALDPGFCNSLLYNCWETWKLSYPELRMIHAKFEALGLRSTDEVTPRLLSQAVQRERKGHSRVRLKAIAVSRQAYLGRSTNKREIFEAMNQEVMNEKPMAAVMIYKRAMRFGMPFCSHCHRLAVLAAFRRQQDGSEYALSIIRSARVRGHDITHAMATFIKCEIDSFPGSPDDLIVHMQTLISRLEASQLGVRPEVLTHMAVTCSRVGHPEKAIALCNLARHRSGLTEHCFSKSGFKALSTAYSQILDINGLRMLLDSLFESSFSSDKGVRLHLKSIYRLVQKESPSHARTTALEIIDNGINRLKKTREETREQGKLISQQALRIFGDALANLQHKKKKRHSASNLSIEPPMPLEAVK